MIAKPTIIKVNALYHEEDKYKVMLLWRNDILDIPKTEKCYVEIHSIEDNGNEIIKFSENVIDNDIRLETWIDNGHPSFITIRTLNDLGPYNEITIPVLSFDPNISKISVSNGYVNFNDLRGGITIGWDYPTGLENSLFCYSILLSGYTPEARQIFYVPNAISEIFIPSSSYISKLNRIKNIVVYAINNNDRSGIPFMYNSI